MIGPLIGADDVCEAIEATLTTWMPSVLAELHAVGKPSLPVPATYEQLPDEATSTTAQFPAVIISSPGLADTPERHGDGSYTLCWAAVVSFILRQGSYRATAKAVRVYATAVRTAVEQHGVDIAGSQVTYTDENYARLPSAAARTLGMGHVAFEVIVPNAMNDSEGADAPPTPPDLTPDAPTQTSDDISLIKESA